MLITTLKICYEAVTKICVIIWWQVTKVLLVNFVVRNYKKLMKMKKLFSKLKRFQKIEIKHKIHKSDVLKKIK